MISQQPPFEPKDAHRPPYHSTEPCAHCGQPYAVHKTNGGLCPGDAAHVSADVTVQGSRPASAIEAEVRALRAANELNQQELAHLRGTVARLEQQSRRLDTSVGRFAESTNQRLAVVEHATSSLLITTGLVSEEELSAQPPTATDRAGRPLDGTEHVGEVPGLEPAPADDLEARIAARANAPTVDVAASEEE